MSSIVRLRHAAATLAALATAVMLGCGDTTQGSGPSRATASPTSLGQGGKRMLCERGFIGPGSADWRRHSIDAGPIGLSGAAANFSRLGRRSPEDGLFHLKTPMIVEGHRTVELVVPRGERHRVALDVDAGGPYRRLIFLPCDDKPRTPWAAGLVLRDRGPVTLEARWGERRARLRVGDE